MYPFDAYVGVRCAFVRVCARLSAEQTGNPVRFVIHHGPRLRPQKDRRPSFLPIRD